MDSLIMKQDQRLIITPLSTLQNSVGSGQGGYIRETSTRGLLTDLYSASCIFSIPECQEI
jgi:hypothetical protein